MDIQPSSVPHTSPATDALPSPAQTHSLADILDGQVDEAALPEGMDGIDGEIETEAKTGYCVECEGARLLR